MVENSNQENPELSMCDVLKTNTSKIINKLESQAPSILQHYSNLYTEYLHMWDDIFGTCYISEKEFFDKLNIDPKILKQLKENSDSINQNCLDIMDANAKYIHEYFKIRISSVKSLDSFIHVMVESYAKSLSQFNKINTSK